MGTATVKRRRVEYQDFDALLADVNHLHEVGYTMVKQWDLSRMLDHIGGGMKTAMRGAPRMAPWLIRKLIGTRILKQILRAGRMKEDVKVPKWALPGPSRDESVAVADFRALTEEFKRFSGPTQPHPFFGPLDYETWSRLTLIHAAHHLSFLSPKS